MTLPQAGAASGGTLGLPGAPSLPAPVCPFSEVLLYPSGSKIPFPVLLFLDPLVRLRGCVGAVGGVPGVGALSQAVWGLFSTPPSFVCCALLGPFPLFPTLLPSLPSPPLDFSHLHPGHLSSFMSASSSFLCPPPCPTPGLSIHAVLPDVAAGLRVGWVGIVQFQEHFLLAAPAFLRRIW